MSKCMFCGQRQLISGQFNCETERKHDGTWVRGWLCMRFTKYEDGDWAKYVAPDVLNYTRPEYPEHAIQREMFT